MGDGAVWMAKGEDSDSERASEGEPVLYENESAVSVLEPVGPSGKRAVQWGCIGAVNFSAPVLPYYSRQLVL